ncbi:MAG: hypothetical protein AAF492_03860 [Verrucomicrobiota bacterium]
MNEFPYITDYVNDVFTREKRRLDYIFLRPIVLIFYFFLRLIVFPLKYLLHRNSWGFEGRIIDGMLAFGMKYLASHDAAELLIRHVQIEPLLYRYLLAHADRQSPTEKPEPRKLNGIDGDFNVRSLKEIVWNNMTIGHDELSYEIIDRFDKEQFLQHLSEIREEKPEDHNSFSKEALEANRKYSLQLLGCTNVVMMIVITITVFGDLRSTIKALNSFGSDSVVLWCMKHIFMENRNVMTDLDFYMQVYSNRGHYNSSAFFSDPSQYLYYHIVFDEFVYDTLLRCEPVPAAG